MITTARAPASIASSTVASSATGGTATTTSSGGSGRSASERCAGRPSTVSARRLTRNTRRRPLPRIAPRAIQWPHLAWSSDAPTTATDAGANSTERSRRAGASVTRPPSTGGGGSPMPQASAPPSTTIVVPVMYAPPAEARKAITDATSSARPSRPSGMLRSQPATSSGS